MCGARAGAVKKALKQKAYLRALCLALRLRQPNYIYRVILSTPLPEVFCPALTAAVPLDCACCVVPAESGATACLRTYRHPWVNRGTGMCTLHARCPGDASNIVRFELIANRSQSQELLDGPGSPKLGPRTRTQISGPWV